MTVACLALKLTPSEALAAVTINAARGARASPRRSARSRAARRPTSRSGASSHRQIPYWPAADLIRAVVKRGRVVLERAPA